MSAVETQLRSALRDGEGEGVEAARVIVRAHAVQLQRRRTVGATVGVAGAAVLLVGAAAGVGRLGQPGHEPAASDTSAPAAAEPVASCPAGPPALPAASGGAATTLFAQNLVSMTICVYSRQGARSSAVLPAADAKSVAKKLNAQPQQACLSPVAAASGPTVLLLPRSAGGGDRPVISWPQYCRTVSDGVVSRSGGTVTTVINGLADLAAASTRRSPAAGASR